MGLRPKPPAATRGDPIAPLRGRRGALCAAWGTGASMSPSPLPPTCTDLAVLIARLGLRGIIILGLSPKPPAATRGDPIAPLRGRRGALCAAWGTGASMSPDPLPPTCTDLAVFIARLGLRGIITLGLSPKPPAATRGDPIAPLRGRRGALCAAWGTGASMSPSPLHPTCTDLGVCAVERCRLLVGMAGRRAEPSGDDWRASQASGRHEGSRPLAAQA